MNVKYKLKNNPYSNLIEGEINKLYYVEIRQRSSIERIKESMEFHFPVDNRFVDVEDEKEYYLLVPAGVTQLKR